MPNEEAWLYDDAPPPPEPDEVPEPPANDLDPFAGALTKNKKKKASIAAQLMAAKKPQNYSWASLEQALGAGGTLQPQPPAQPGVPVHGFTYAVQATPPTMPPGPYLTPIPDPVFPPPHDYASWSEYFNALVQDYGDINAANRRYIEKVNYMISRYHQVGQYGYNPSVPPALYAVPHTPTGGLKMPVPAVLDSDEEELPVLQGQNGPMIVAHRKGREGKWTCQTCGYGFDESQFVTTADAVKICKRCYETYNHCGYCGFKPKVEEFRIKEFVHSYCPDCAPVRKTKLNIKQRREFEPKRDLLGARRERVWPRVSS